VSLQNSQKAQVSRTSRGRWVVVRAQWDQARRNRATLDMRVAMKASDRDALQSFVAQTAAAETQCERLRERAMAVLEQEQWELNVRIAAAKTSTSLPALQVRARRVRERGHSEKGRVGRCTVGSFTRQVNGRWEGDMGIYHAALPFVDSHRMCKGPRSSPVSRRAKSSSLGPAFAMLRSNLPNVPFHSSTSTSLIPSPFNPSPATGDAETRAAVGW